MQTLYTRLKPMLKDFGPVRTGSVPNIDSKLEDLNYSKPPIVTENLLPKHQDHSYATKRDIYLDINLQYADDISWISNADHKIEDVKKRIPNQLESFNLHVNETTEEHRIKRGGNDNWKQCKYTSEPC